jgi:hypothetical protein
LGCAISGPLLSADYLGRADDTVALPPSLVGAYRAVRAPVGRTLGPASHAAQVFSVAVRPLIRWLGWLRPSSASDLRGKGLTYALVAPRADPVVLVVVPHGRAHSTTRLAASDALTHGTRWILVTDGQLLRLVDGPRGGTRGFLDFDLDECMSDLRSLAWFRRLVGPMAFVPSAETYLLRCLDASDAHGRRVCRGLRQGVGDALGTFTSAVAEARGRRSDLQTCYAEALTAVYRTLFLLFAEARRLVPMWHPVYRRGYSIEAISARLAESRPPRGTWAALQAIARLAHSGAVAGDLLVTPFNGRLFAPSRAPLLDHLALDDGRVSRALDALCFTRAPDGAGRQRIAYAELDVEELGSVYESLLDLEPVVSQSGTSADRRPTTPAVGLRRSTSAARKTTGTFYTPRTIADVLVRDTLAPLVEGRSAEEILSLRVLDPSMGSGAFLVAVGRYLADEWERAVIARGDATEGDVSDSDRAATRRLLASRSLFGVDRNPMAVQLAQLSVWLATLSADRPLSFLDHHLVAGNSLVGAAPLDVLARPPGKGRRPMPLPLDSLFEWSDALVSVRAARHDIETVPDDTADVVRRKEAALAGVAHDPGLARWKAACDLWCAGWTPGGPSRNVYHALLDECLGRSTLVGAFDAPRRELTARARALACFHWPLEFPEVFLDELGRPRPDGGFDAVVGNPPWEMLRADSRRDAAAADDGGALVRFARDSGIYLWQGRGHANQFHLFVERALHLARPGGRIGLVVPASLLSDEGSGSLRRGLISANQLDALTVFDNRRAIFPIHRSFRFATLTARRSGRTDTIRCRFGVADPEAVEATPQVTVTPRLVEQLSGPGLAIPDLPTPYDLRLVESLSRSHPALSDSTGWHAAFSRELNATDDGDCMCGDAAPGAFPVIEGRHLSPFRVDLAAVGRYADSPATRARLGARANVDRPRLAYRDVASASNRTTLIAAIVPAGTVTVHTVFCLQSRLTLDAQRVLCALLNSYVANYLVRRRVVTHVTTAIISRLPVPLIGASSPQFSELLAAARVLQGAADAAAMAVAQAVAAEAYGVSEDDLAHVLSTFPLVPAQERAAVLDAFVSRTRPRSCR